MQQVQLKPRPAPDGLFCSKCRGTQFETHWQTFTNGTKHIRMDCVACGAFVRYAKQHGSPEPRYEPRRPGAHAAELATPPDSWHWIGLIRQSDQLWNPVAYAPTLAKVWDCLLTYPGEGDRLAIPTRPATATARSAATEEEAA